MSPPIALIDYGAGNLTSVQKAFAALQADILVPATPDALADASAIVIPGVGHFDRTRSLHAEWRQAIWGAADRGRPLLGICLGMQWLFEESEEAPGCQGLGLLPGRCFRLSGNRQGNGTSRPTERLKVPHVGWNALMIDRPAPIISGIEEGAQVYFTHSFAAPRTVDTVASTEHGDRFAAIVARDQITGVQFHPEKSGEVGMRLLENFLAQIV